MTHKLHRKAGGVHGWKPDAEELTMIADWFDTHLAKELITEENPVDLEVQVTGGTIRGTEVEGLKQYLGIPYTALPEWPAFTMENEAYMELGANLRVGNNLEMPRVDLIGKAWAKRRQAAMGDDGQFKSGDRLW